MEIKISGKIIHEQAPSIKLIKGQKDTYGWEVKASGIDTKRILEQIKEVNDMLLGEYGKEKGSDES